MQDLRDFKGVTDSPRNYTEAQRLRELADLIPMGYGSGAEMDQALEEILSLQAKLNSARLKGKKAGSAYAEHIALMHEERSILQSLSLTANLFRKDSQ